MNSGMRGRRGKLGRIVIKTLLFGLGSCAAPFALEMFLIALSCVIRAESSLLIMHGWAEVGNNSIVPSETLIRSFWLSPTWNHVLRMRAL